jgi:hypothetical protein
VQLPALLQAVACRLADESAGAAQLDADMVRAALKVSREGMTWYSADFNMHFCAAQASWFYVWRLSAATHLQQVHVTIRCLDLATAAVMSTL